MRRVLITVLLTCMSGCMGPHYAQINDVVLPGSLNSGYQIVAVDGAAANRGVQHVSTAPPQVLLEPGTHKLTIESKDKSVRKDFTATIAPDRQYRIAMDDAGEPKLVEDGK